MGLDMYLEREHYIGGQYQHVGASGVIRIETKHNKTLELDPTKVASINEHVGYWRKANAIHNFFVEKAQDGRDECQRSYVPNKLLIELRNTCKVILRAKVEHGMESEEVGTLVQTLLPPTSGFFFGSTNIDEYYFQNLEHTLDVLKDVKENEGDYYYQASW